MFFVFSIYKPLNNHFEYYGFNDMNFMVETGSLILPIIPLMVAQHTLKYALHKLSICYYKKK